jgi:NAD(P)-dependent dehydrogenase (short-subunit alcohol dehydrogenase family)
MNLQQLTQWYDFTGCTFVVTGGTGVLGGEVAGALAGLGANVVVLERKLSPEQGFIERMGANGAQTLAVHADVLNRDSLLAAAEQIRTRFGPVHGLINAAGGNQPGATTNPERTFFDLPEEALRYVFDLNLLGTFLPCQVFGQQLAASGEGVILNFSSMSAFSPLTRVVAYSAAKAAINNFTQWLAVYLAQSYGAKLRVNAIAPGFFLGEQNRFLLTDRETGELTPRGRTIIEHTPMARFGTPADLLGTVLWLLSPAAAFVTGITVPVDGGFSAFGGV